MRHTKGMVKVKNNSYIKQKLKRNLDKDTILKEGKIRSLLCMHSLKSSTNQETGYPILKT